MTNRKKVTIKNQHSIQMGEILISPSYTRPILVKIYGFFPGINEAEIIRQSIKSSNSYWLKEFEGKGGNYQIIEDEGKTYRDELKGLIC